MATNRRSRIYGITQSVLLCLFAGVLLFVREPVLFISPISYDIGIVLGVAGLLLMGAAFAALRKVIQIDPEPKSGGELVTGGVYRYLRHPIYTAIGLLIIGFVLRKPTSLVTLCGAVVIAFLFVKTRFEERLLAARYPGYPDYRTRTWGLIPGLK
jgi:protein-S-isoprenylcysteine O-methyltransferase Ste14